MHRVRQYLHHPSYRRSVIFVVLLLTTGVSAFLLYRMESCYDPCYTVRNWIGSLFGFWDARPESDLVCKIPGVAERICPVPQTSPFFYVVFDIFALLLLVYFGLGLQEMQGRWKRGESIVAPKL